MLIYMAVPVLIMIGLCILFYMAGRYVRIGKRQKEVKAPEIIKMPEPPKEPDRVPILEEEIMALREALDLKNEALEKSNNTAESLMQENQKLLAQARQESIDKMDAQKEEIEDTGELEESIPQPEKEPVANNISGLPVSLSYEDVLKELEEKVERKNPEEKAKRKKPEEKVKRKKPEEKVKLKKPLEKAKRKPRRKKR